MQRRGMYSGEGGVMGLAAAYAGWTLDFETLAATAACIRHQGGGPDRDHGRLGLARAGRRLRVYVRCGAAALKTRIQGEQRRRPWSQPGAVNNS
jgi:hypothetical protein